MYKCKDCGREITNETYSDVTLKNYGEEPPCKECGGEFYKVDDEYESDSYDYECDECGISMKDELNLIKFHNAEVSICKSCIDNKYPRKSIPEEVSETRKKLIESKKIGSEEEDSEEIPKFMKNTRFD